VEFAFGLPAMIHCVYRGGIGLPLAILYCSNSRISSSVNVGFELFSVPGLY
jgi:uncharacterized membrane protein